MSRIAATDRLARLIAAIPWIAATDGASLDEIAERFDYPRDLLVTDLQEIVFYVGVPPYTPDTLIEVLIEDDLVWIRYADWFAQPMRLSGSEALALIAAGESVLGFTEQDESGPLVRALTKVRLATGSSDEVVDVEFGSTAAAALDPLREGLNSQRGVNIVYHGFASNKTTERVIEPHRIFFDRGAAYVAAYCRLAEAERVFRIDRIEHADLTDAEFGQDGSDNTTAAVGGEVVGDGFSLHDGTPVTIDAPLERAYVLEGVPVTSIERGEKRIRAELRVASSRWLEQLLLRLGSDAQLISGSFDTDVVGAAERIRSRYSSDR